MESELVEDYELEEGGTDFHKKGAAGPWLASGSGELNGEAKKNWVMKRKRLFMII